MYNLELPGGEEITVREVRLRPLPNHRDQVQKIAKASITPKAFVHTADAIVQLGPSEASPENPRQAAWEMFGPIHDALTFLQQRDFRASEWWLHDSPECDEAPVTGGYSAGSWQVPYETKIKIVGDYSHALEKAVDLWSSNDEVEQKTGYWLACQWQHVSLRRFNVIQVSYITQWMAFEVLFNRWYHARESALKQRYENHRSLIKSRLRNAMSDIFQPLVESGEMLSCDYEYLESKLVNIRPSITHIASAFLESVGIGGISEPWLRKCQDIRSQIVHGPRTAKRAPDPHDMHNRKMVLRTLVIRYIMSLIGYAPKDWRPMEWVGDRYVPVDK